MLDTMLLYPGHMDLHINMTYMRPHEFRVLTSNYLGIEDHVLFSEINKLRKTTQATPTEVAEQLIRHDNPDIILNGLLNLSTSRRKKLFTNQSSN